jgi:hypothetical protein
MRCESTNVRYCEYILWSECGKVIGIRTWSLQRTRGPLAWAWSWSWRVWLGCICKVLWMRGGFGAWGLWRVLEERGWHERSEVWVLVPNRSGKVRLGVKGRIWLQVSFSLSVVWSVACVKGRGDADRGFVLPPDWSGGELTGAFSLSEKVLQSQLLPFSLLTSISFPDVNSLSRSPSGTAVPVTLTLPVTFTSHQRLGLALAQPLTFPPLGKGTFPTFSSSFDAQARFSISFIFFSCEHQRLRNC